MRIAVVGGGPAGLYAAILIRRLQPTFDICLYEQNSADATWGFGVVFSDQALAFLREDDPETADLIEPAMKRWSDITVVHRGERVRIDGVGFAGIARLHLLQLLQRRAARLAVVTHYDRRIESVHDIDADLVIGADGLNSIVRASADFGAHINTLSNRFVWYGAECEFDTLTQTFIETVHGPVNAHHYAYAPGQSTFIIEMPETVFERTGFAGMAEPEYRAICAEYFAGTLKGAPLIANNSVWRRFPELSCEKWHVGNRVLVGDALHTAHFSIGSGTRLALEDAIALVRALEDNDWDLACGLPAYRQARQPVLDKLIAAGRASARWYECFADHMQLEPWSFANSYIQRAGRVDRQRLGALAPQFARELEVRGIET